jgi:hypothetical protein
MVSLGRNAVVQSGRTKDGAGGAEAVEPTKPAAASTASTSRRNRRKLTGAAPRSAVGAATSPRSIKVIVS